MKRPKRDSVREDRIYNEAIVDARPEEQAMSWHYYLEGKISFRFRARCMAANAVSPLQKGKPSKSYAWPSRMHASMTC
jgi:Calcium binding